MLKVDKITQRFGIFIVSYILLLMLFQLKPVQQIHNVYYCSVGQTFFNIINPNFKADFIAKPGMDEDGYNMSIKLYNKKLHGSRLKSKAYMRRATPELWANKNLYDITIIPTILLLSLYIATPGIKWTKKILLFLGSLAVLYIFLVFHKSYIMENVAGTYGADGQKHIGTGLWNKFIYIFGFAGLTEAVFMISIISYGIFALRKSVLDYFLQKEKA